RAHEVDTRVETARATTREPRPREIDVPVAGAAGPIDLDRCLVVELAEQIRRRRAGRDVELPDELLAVLARWPVHTLRILIRAHPDVAERLRRPFCVAGTFRAGEQSPMPVPRQHRIARIGSPDLRRSGIRRAVARIPLHDRAGT